MVNFFIFDQLEVSFSTKKQNNLKVYKFSQFLSFVFRKTRTFKLVKITKNWFYGQILAVFFNFDQLEASFSTKKQINLIIYCYS